MGSWAQQVDLKVQAVRLGYIGGARPFVVSPPDCQLASLIITLYTYSMKRVHNHSIDSRQLQRPRLQFLHIPTNNSLELQGSQHLDDPRSITEGIDKQDIPARPGCKSINNLMRGYTGRLGHKGEEEFGSLSKVRSNP
jgi:hypothetical protein